MRFWEISLHKAEGKPDQQGHQKRKDDTPLLSEAQRGDEPVEEAEVAVENHDADHGDQSGDAADGDVDASGDHDDGQTAGDDDEEGVVIEHVKEHLRLAEAAAPDQHGKHIHRDKDADRDRQKQLGIRDGLSAANGLNVILLVHPLMTPPFRCGQGGCPGDSF